MNRINYQVEALAQAELNANEKLVWSAAPAPSRLARRTLPIALFAIPFTAFAIFWIAGASGFKIPDFRSGSGFFPLFGLPFLLVGLGMLSAPLWAMRNAKRTGYFITERRAILIEKRILSGYKIRSFYPAELTNIERIQFPNGTGDVILARQLRTTNNNGQQTIPIGFFGIPEAREVEKLLTTLAQSPSNPPT